MGSPRIGNQILAQPNSKRNSSTLVCTITGRMYDAGRSDRRFKTKVRELPRLERDNSTEYWKPL